MKIQIVYSLNTSALYVDEVLYDVDDELGNSPYLTLLQQLGAIVLPSITIKSEELIEDFGGEFPDILTELL